MPFDVRRARPSLPCSPTVASFQKDSQICVRCHWRKNLVSRLRIDLFFIALLRWLSSTFSFFSSCLSRQNGCCAFVCNIFFIFNSASGIALRIASCIYIHIHLVFFPLSFHEKNLCHSVGDVRNKQTKLRYMVAEWKSKKSNPPTHKRQKQN